MASIENDKKTVYPYIVLLIPFSAHFMQSSVDISRTFKAIIFMEYIYNTFTMFLVM